MRGLDEFREAHHLQLDIAHFWLPLGRTPPGMPVRGPVRYGAHLEDPPFASHQTLSCPCPPTRNPWRPRWVPGPTSAQPPRPLLCRADHPPPVRPTVGPHRPWGQVLCPLLQPRGVGSAEPRRSTWSWAEWAGMGSQSSQAMDGTAMGQVWLRASDPAGDPRPLPEVSRPDPASQPRARLQL